MKNLFFFCLALFAALALVAQPKAGDPVAKPAFTWEKGTTHDFGKIPVGKPVTWRFSFTNSGDEALTVSHAQASCGCTTPKWSTEPVAPGAKGYVDATFNAGSVGMFNKTVTLTSNAGEQIVLHLTGEVVTQ